MRKEWGKQKQLLKLGTGAFCVGMGHALWVPFVISDRLGGAEASGAVRSAGAFLLAAGAALLLWGLGMKEWKEWGKLFLFFGFLQICLSMLCGFLALLVLSLSGDNAGTAKAAADFISTVLALPVHAWMLCLTGHLIKRERFALWFPSGLFLQFLFLCFLAALCQFFFAGLPDGTAGILVQGILGGFLLFAMLCLMLKLTERQLSGEEIKESKTRAGITAALPDGSSDRGTVEQGER